MNPLLTYQWFLIGIFGLTFACGNEADFQALPPSSSDWIAANGDFTLNWSWHCSSSAQQTTEDSANLASDGSNAIELVGGGKHRLKVHQADHIKLSLDRTNCAPEDSPRDIIFVVDVSGSMKDNDPLINNTCGRFEAIDLIISRLSHPENVQIGLITFGHEVVITTNTLLRADEFRSSSFFQKSNLCAAEGSTSYKQALAQSIKLLSPSDVETLKEIYFISDGEPAPGEEGLAESQQLKNGISTKAIIATLMIKGNDEQLLSIASRDQYGAPLHRRTENISELVDLLSELSSSTLAKVLFHYKDAKDEEWNVEDIIDLEPEQSLQSFPSFEVSEFRNGLKIKIESIDSRGQITSTENAELRWQD
jgi:uncharacterized protein YegL